MRAQNIPYVAEGSKAVRLGDGLSTGVGPLQ